MPVKGKSKCTLLHNEWNEMQQNNMPLPSFSRRLKCRNEMAGRTVGGPVGRLTTLAICIILIPFSSLEASNRRTRAVMSFRVFHAHPRYHDGREPWHHISISILDMDYTNKFCPTNWVNGCRCIPEPGEHMKVMSPHNQRRTWASGLEIMQIEEQADELPPQPASNRKTHLTDVR